MISSGLMLDSPFSAVNTLRMTQELLLAAIAHSSSNSDFFCVSPGSFRVRLRSAKDDLKRVTLHFQDKYIPLKYIDTREEKPMEVYASDGLLDYWEAELEMELEAEPEMEPEAVIPILLQ